MSNFNLTYSLTQDPVIKSLQKNLTLSVILNSSMHECIYFDFILKIFRYK